MIIDIVVILKLYLIFNSIDNRGVRIRYPYPNTNTCVIIRTPYIILDKLYIIYEPTINYYYSKLPISRTRKGPGKVSDLARFPT